MTFSSRFAVAIHVTALIAACPETCVSSEKIAQSVGTNPVVIRRIILQLKQAGIIKSIRGKTGGAQLSKPPSQISLFEILQAVEPDLSFQIHDPPPNSSCHIANSISSIILDVSGKVERSLSSALGGVSLAKIVSGCKKK